MYSTLIRAVGAGILLSLSGAPVLAQVPLTPRALGMGGAYAGVARGDEALFLNPANLGLSDTPRWSVALPQFALGGTTVGTTLGDLLESYGAPEERRAEVLDAIPASGAEVRYHLRLPLLVAQKGRFGFGVAYGSVGQHTVGRDLAELVFAGYQEGRTDYSVGNTRGSRVSFLDFAAGYARRVGPVSVGLTGHYVHGRTVLQSRLFEPRIDVYRQNIEIDYLSVYSKGGRGYGLDAGVALEPTRSITLSAAVSNLYSRMQWSDELYTRSLRVSRADVDAPGGMALLERYQESERKVEPGAAPLEVYQTAEGLFDGTYLPAVARLGAAWKGSRGTDLALGFQDRLTDGRMGDGWDRMASAGLQQRLPLVTLRAGYATNLEGGDMVTGGVSLGPMQLGVARLNDGEMQGAPRSGYIVTLGIGFRTQQMLDR